jgi:hypothetical protein
MENQHRKIKGYRELNEVEIALMNEIKGFGAKIGEFIDNLQRANVEVGDTVPDPRWLAIGKTHLQEGLMALTRSIAKPDFF